MFESNPFQNEKTIDTNDDNFSEEKNNGFLNFHGLNCSIFLIDFFEPIPEKLQKGNSEEQAPFIHKPDPENSSLEKTFKNFVSSTNKNAEKISIKSLNKFKISS